MKSVLLIFSKQSEALQKRVNDAFRTAGVMVDTETSAMNLRARLEARKYSYLVCELHLAMQDDTPVLPDGGLKVCAAARKLSDVPIALIAPHPSNEITFRANAIRPPVPLVLTPEDTLTRTLAEHLRTIKIRPARLDVVIRAEDHWSYLIHANGVPYKPRGGPLCTNRRLLTAQEKLSERLLDRPEEWYTSFKELGQLILGDLLDSNAAFRDELSDGIKAVESINNTRLTFSVARNLYQIALEAIQCPSPDLAEEPWMIHAPLVRSVHGAAPPSSSLFDGPPEPLRCLVICADTSGVVDEVAGADGNPIVLAKLKAIQTESENVKAMLENQREQWNIEAVESLGHPGDQPLTPDRLFNVLRDGEWHLIHYAGHTKVQSNGGKQGSGYLFVGEQDDPQPVEVSRVAPYLRHSKLLYLSSCESANATFAVEAAKHGIPAVIGFRWPIRDSEALRHAELFYQRLMEHQAIDTAFWSVRKAIHDASRQNNTWASSVLVMN